MSLMEFKGEVKEWGNTYKFRRKNRAWGRSSGLPVLSLGFVRGDAGQLTQGQGRVWTQRSLGTKILRTFPWFSGRGLAATYSAKPTCFFPPSWSSPVFNLSVAEARNLRITFHSSLVLTSI